MKARRWGELLGSTLELELALGMEDVLLRPGGEGLLSAKQKCVSKTPEQTDTEKILSVKLPSFISPLYLFCSADEIKE